MSGTPPGSSLDTPRLRLVPCGPEHGDRLHAILIEEDVRRHFLDGQIVTRAWVDEVVESSRATFAASGFGLWCLCERERGTMVGMAGLRVTPGAREPQLLYVLERGSWGRGYATEASEAVAAHAFGALGHAELLASTDPPNQASIRVMERLGMRFLEAGRMAGHPLVVYALRREDWLSRREDRAGTSAPAGATTTRARS